MEAAGICCYLALTGLLMPHWSLRRRSWLRFRAGFPFNPNIRFVSRNFMRIRSSSSGFGKSPPWYYHGVPFLPALSQKAVQLLRFKLGTVRHDFAGHNALASLYAQTKDCVFDDIEIDMSQCDWFDADMCAPLGAILYTLSTNLNTVSIVNVPAAIEEVLSKNTFLQNYGRANRPDTWNTTIPYQRFDVTDGKFFGSYVQSGLMRRPELPSMSSALKKKLCESVFEIFHNSVTHSHTELGIYCCGQFFPAKHCIDFCIADLGIGIRRNIEMTTTHIFTAAQAIQWATEGRNTTKSGPIPGGLGLKLLREFVGLNGGRIQIISEDGYWSQSGKNSPLIGKLSASFPGTAVNVEINTADQNSYALASEVSSESIF